MGPTDFWWFKPYLSARHSTAWEEKFLTVTDRTRSGPPPPLVITNQQPDPFMAPFAEQAFYADLTVCNGSRGQTL